MFDVIGVGRSCIDHLAVLSSMPRVDRKVPMIRYRVVGGGQTATAMAALSRLGLRVAYVGMVGDDAEGEMVVDGLKREGVDTSGVMVERGVPTPIALIFIEEKTGLRTIAFLDSMKGRPFRERIDAEMILSARCLLIDPQGTQLGIAISAEARRRGVTVVYDAEHMVDGFYEMISSCDHVVGSEDVVDTLGLTVPEEALEKLLSLGPETAVITRGAGGSIALSSAGFIRAPAYKVDVVDTTAAGDAFHAGFIYAVLKKWDLRRTLEFSNAMGALVCRGLGGRESLPTLDEVGEMLARRASHG